MYAQAEPHGSHQQFGLDVTEAEQIRIDDVLDSLDTTNWLDVDLNFGIAPTLPDEPNPVAVTSGDPEQGTVWQGGQHGAFASIAATTSNGHLNHPVYPVPTLSTEVHELYEELTRLREE